jgi:hypothetical protein
MKWCRLLTVVSVMLVMLLSASPIARADNTPGDDPGIKVDIGVDGEVKVDISASGPAELNVEAKGPAQVSIDVGDEVKLNVEAADESHVLIDYQGIDNPVQPDEPARQPETGYDSPAVDLDNSSSELNNPITRLNNYAIILAVFPAVGLLAFYLISHSIEHGKTKQSNERR